MTSSTGRSRLPLGPTRVATAPAAMSAGTLSAAGEPLQRLPPRVARPCTWVDPMRFAASTTPGHAFLSRACSFSSAPVTAAPMRQLPFSSVTARVSLIFLMSTIRSGSRTSARIWTRRSVPPASTLASPCAEASRATAPSNESGASYRISLVSPLVWGLYAPADMIPQPVGAASGASELQILVGGHVETGDGGGHDVVHPGPHPDRKAQVIDRHLDDLLLEDALDLVEQGLTLLAVQLAGLAAEEIVHLGQRAVGERSALGDERLEPGGCIAGDAADGQDYPMELLVAPRRHERPALHGAHTRANAHRLEPPLDGLAHRVVGRERGQLAGVEAARVSGLGQELARAGGIIRRRLHRQRELEVARDGVPDRAREPQGLRLVQGLAVQRQARGLPHALVRPGRLRIPLVGEVEPEDAEQRRGQAQARRPLDLLRGGAAQQHGHVHLAALERGRARGLVGQAAEDYSFYGRLFSPVAVERLHHQLHARVEAHELVRPGPDRKSTRLNSSH